ncbi:MAG TPA: hypothetical protein VF585_04595 [Chthoniobacterales bacterium]|jgi:hypothetical protein
MSNPHFSARIINHSHGQGATTVDDVQQRASELARIDGRPPEAFTASDLEEARRELMGGHYDEDESGGDYYSLGVDNVAGSIGHHIPNISSDESENAVAELIMEGMEEAEHEQMLEASALLEDDEL